MSKEEEFRHGATAQENGADTQGQEEHRGEHHPSRLERDEEIRQLEERSRHQRQEIVPPPELPPASPRRALMVVGAFLVGLLVAGAISVGVRVNHSRALAKETELGSVPTVLTVHPKAEAPDEELVLPGSLQAFKESPIFARTSGYLVNWYKDIGSRVKQGELLAKIDTPEVDQELNQARASRQQILAQMQLAKISADRWENLRKTDSVSAQEADQQSSGYQQAQANLAAADANVRRLEQLESFKNVFAPFSGVLTRRNVDPGALINAGAGGVPMFNLAQVDPLRVYTSVPQAYAAFIKLGAKATVTLQEFPGEKFHATIARTADAIDPTTRTLLTEVDVPNKDGRLLPGSYGQVHFAVPSDVHKLVIPVNAMLFRAQGPQVGVVGADGTVHLRAINIGRDYGATLEVLGGLEETEQIIINPSDSLEDGQQVHVAPPTQGGPQGGGAAPQAKGKQS
ncbi:MAG TPA: efflux RND transporter periplasmic adaptor subunit [Candidatus Acidoferrales bacterium]|nr:efflux RND transporter periplasmic adaptor subunit [Candidatus Acidoferrales bacterium]